MKGSETSPFTWFLVNGSFFISNFLYNKFRLIQSVRIFEKRQDSDLPENIGNCLSGFGEGFWLVSKCFIKKFPAWAGSNADNFAKDCRWLWMKPDKNSGSRYSDGNVPNVNFNPNTGKVNVNWYNPGNANPNLRSRQEVSAKKSHLKKMGFLAKNAASIT